ncbi:MAG: putative metal-binding motif-containing protein, partial [bacterium]
CDGVDNNCDGDTDEENAIGCTVYYLDVDNDTYGVSGNSRCLCQPDTQTHHTATVDGDCNDSRQMVNPGMVEQCATSDDDDCDGDTNDEGAFGCTTFFRDSDHDTYGVSSDTACFCVAVGDYTATTGGDCDDVNASANPGQIEDCLTQYDDNCNASTNDQNALNCTDYYVDMDQDNYGQTFLSQCLCTGQGNYTASLPNDCNDNNANVNPAVPEDCSTGFDDNCNQDTNEQNALNCTDYYFDADNDGHGLTNDYQCRCAPLGNYRATVGGDCNDGNPSVNPSALETCATVFDDNCDGDVNDLNASGCNIYYLDQDGDTYGVAGNSQCRCDPQGNYQASVTGDCNDNNPQVHPAMSETCDTAFDDNCDGVTNELNALNCVSFFWDEDTDGYGTSLAQCRCGPYDLYTASLSGDCQDQNVAVNPGAPEICDNIDNNCVNGVDEGFDKQSDINHCGACGNTCTNGHGTTVCVSGVCTPTCAAGWGDCNGDPDDGCETDLSSVGTCGSCNFDFDCPPDFYCDGTDTCAAEKPDGDSCSRDEECTSDHCVDGYCCDTACDGTCEACDIASSEGTCTPHTNGLDPDNECSDTGQDTCGQNGSCDGNGGCALWASGTVCVQQTCTGNTLYLNDTCDGAGSCNDGGTQDCSPYLCDGIDCRTSCTLNSHCVGGYHCEAPACVAD